MPVSTVTPRDRSDLSVGTDHDRSGTIASLGLTTALTLPFLFSRYQVGIKAFSPDFLERNVCFTYDLVCQFPRPATNSSSILKDAAAAVAKTTGIPEGSLDVLWGTITDSVKGVINTGVSSTTLPPKPVVADPRTLKASREFALVSSAHTSVTHIFHHADILHWATNIFSIISTGLKLQLGFVKTSILIVGGGIFGSWANVVEWRFYRPLTPSLPQSADQNPGQMDIVDMVTTGVKEVGKQLGITGAQSPYIVERRRHVLCGASASAFALMGADLYLIAKEIVPVSRRLAARFRNSGNTVEESVLRQRLEQLAWQLSARLLTIGAEVLAVNQWTSPSNLSHSSHLGGLVFGVVAMAVFDSAM
ncbi:hypothetical protein BJ742DRAFT_541336 [Cladochytrium replicatum]|nr:hypothetical protein BJ742DRAFT_541336 [Cladochytrium replicatum]